MITAMVLACGNGTRVGEDCPKQFVKVLGKPVLVYAIEIFQNHPEVDAVEVVCHKDWIDSLQEMIVAGGENFQKSV